jgi:hypothetical protein
MSRYIEQQEPVVIRDPTTDIATGEPPRTLSWACRRVLANAIQQQSADALTIIDLRRKTDSLEKVRCIELTEDEWKILEPEFRKPRVFGPAYVFGAEAHIRAIIDAPTKRPTAMLENGATEVPALPPAS